jgi:hypothetical protein
VKPEIITSVWTRVQAKSGRSSNRKLSFWCQRLLGELPLPNASHIDNQLITKVGLKNGAYSNSGNSFTSSINKGLRYMNFYLINHKYMKFILIFISFLLWCKTRFKPETKPWVRRRRF